MSSWFSAEGRTLRRKDADDDVRAILHLDRLAQRAFRGKELRQDAQANDDHRARQFDVVRGELRPTSIEYWFAARKCSLLPPNVRPGAVLRLLHTACRHFRCDQSCLQAHDIGRAFHQPLETHGLIEGDVATKIVLAPSSGPPPFDRVLGELNMFEPRKLRPVSIDVRSTVTAVITPMTEKTPIVMPNMVRPDRSLLAPKEPSAMRKISTRTHS